MTTHNDVICLVLERLENQTGDTVWERGNLIALAPDRAELLRSSGSITAPLDADALARLVRDVARYVSPAHPVTDPASDPVSEPALMEA